MSNATKKSAPVKFAILNKDEAFKSIETLSKDVRSIERRVQSLCLTAVGYANVHGDTTVATKIATGLFNAIGAGARRQAIINLIETYGKLEWNNKEKAFAYRKREDVETDPAALVLLFCKAENHWTRFTPEPEPVSTVDALEAFKHMMARLGKAAKRKGVTMEHAEIYNRLGEILAEVETAE